MFIDLSKILKKNDEVAVALSGGSDSMALLHYLLSVKDKYGITVKALNVEHGIRGEESLNDTKFVKNYCQKKGIELLAYSVDCITHSKVNKLSLENSARLLRYQCFNDALSTGKCTKIATAHHLEDNTESVLINLFRGTGVKGMIGVNDSDNIIRPLLDVKKSEILEYLAQNDIPYVTDSTNACEDYTRNYLRLEVLPLIRKVFPEVDNSIARFCQIAKSENEFLDNLSSQALLKCDDYAKINTKYDDTLLARAIIKALQHLGVDRDWEKVHIDSVIALKSCENGCSINLPKSVVAIKEYDFITLYIACETANNLFSFSLGEFDFSGKKLLIKKINREEIVDFKNGYYVDLDKIPNGAQIRTRKDGDIFAKFGGGTKKLNDYFTDVKIPVRIRNDVPLIAYNENILAVCGYAISRNVKLDENSQNVAQIIVE